MNDDLLAKLSNLVDNTQREINVSLKLCKLNDSEGDLAERLERDAKKMVIHLSESYAKLNKSSEVSEDIDRAIKQFIDNVKESLIPIGSFSVLFESALIEIDSIAELIDSYKPPVTIIEI